MKSASRLEISRSAVKNNLDFLRNLFGENVTISSVVKGNAYGHHIETYVPIAEEFGIRHFSVFSSDEAERALSAAKKSTIMIMGYLADEDLEWAVSNKIEFFVFNISRLKKAIETAKTLNDKAIIHIEVETGLNRTGFNKDELREVIEIIKSSGEYLIIKGLCTHFAGAESIANHYRIQNQITIYNQLYDYLSNNGIKPEIRHTACSAASIAYPETRMDLVRIGILQYGYWPSQETFIRFFDEEPHKDDPLKRVISWKSKIMSIKNIERGEFIGYGTTFLAHQKMKIAIVPVGYSHGFSRSLSNTGRALIHGKRFGVVGIVNMNAMAIDITNEKVNIGDEVVLIGNQGNLQISVASFSELSSQLNYELLTRLPTRIPRKVIE